MSILAEFIQTYHEKFAKPVPKFDQTLSGWIDKTSHLLLDEKSSPSQELKDMLTGLHARAKEPMKVAITGQFSSGKSTFLNALLSKSVLPTGITPVTSKVNYIRYGDEFKMRIHYKDGRDEYQDVENIARFTDQRTEVEEIDYLTLYAPLEMLKEITFVDTPGLNSQEQSDTTQTQKVLKEVDGIIWLSLIDNAGKLSEVATLEKYLDQYQNKSLCVLNQKDKFTPEQVAKSVAYIKRDFSSFFAQVVPISAKQALLSRSHDKAQLLEESKEQFLTELGEQLNNSKPAEIDSYYKNYLQKVESILSSDLSQNQSLLEDSNIQSVLSFIQTDIRPVAKSAKSFAIKKELVHICDSTIKQHELFLRVYDELIAELETFEQESKQRFSELKGLFGEKLQNAYAQIEDMISVIAQEIYTHVNTSQRTRYVEKKSGLLKRDTLYEALSYQSAKIDTDIVYKHLFYDDDVVGKRFKKYVKELRDIQDEVNQHNAQVYEMLKKRIRAWQSPYEMLRRQNPIHSYIEFAGIRKFSSKAYEHILKPFSDEIHTSYAKISSEFNHLSSAVSFNYQNATQTSIAFLVAKIEQSVKLYEQNPTRFTLYTPKLQEIKDRLSTSFHLYELQNMMQGNTTFLSKNYDTLMREFKQIKQARVSLIEQRKERHKKMIQRLQEHIRDCDGIKC